MDEEGGAGGAPAEEVVVPKKKMTTVMSMTRPSTIDTGERVVVDRTTLETILDIRSRIQHIQKKSKLSMSTLALGHETYKDKQAKAKEARNFRMGGLKNQHRFLLESAGSILNKSVDYILEGVYDADVHIDLLDSVIAEGGRYCIVLCDANLPPLKMESGRFIPQQKGLMERTYLSDAVTIGTVGRCVAMYRLKNKVIDNKNIADETFLVFFNMDPETENVVSAIYNTMLKAYMPAIRACQQWGDLNPPNPNSVDLIKTYISKIMLFMNYLASGNGGMAFHTKFGMAALVK